MRREGVGEVRRERGGEEVREGESRAVTRSFRAAWGWDESGLQSLNERLSPPGV